MQTYINSLLLTINTGVMIAIIAVCVVLSLTIGIFVGKIIVDKIRSAKLGSVESILAKI